MKYDAIIIGGGLAGLTAGSLLAKSNLKVAVIEKSYNPGGTCGSFKRGNVTFDQGAAMLYGFGEAGFNAHHFLFNCLEEPIDMISNDLLYVVNFNGHRIKFWPNVEKFIEELSTVFPNEKDSIRRFYNDMLKLYTHILVETPTYTSADETDPKSALKSIMKHPLSYVKFLGYLNKSAKSLLENYFKDPEIFNFFDKLTSTYCYATVEEAPAVLASVMFVDNHVGGSYYPAGSTMFVPGKLEKVIEEHNGDMFLESEVVEILFDNNKATGVLLKDGRTLEGDNVIYSGTVWNLYEKLIDHKHTSSKKRKWAKSQIPTYPSVVLYSVVDKDVIPDDTASIEMLIGKPDQIDESEVTAYILSINDKTICPEDVHTVVAIGPTFDDWDFNMGDNYSKSEDYKRKKDKEEKRLIRVLDKRFPGFEKGLRYAEIATPCTIERYSMKNGGAVAGPKQMLGQHMLKRQRIRTKWDNLFCCGESTVMGTGTPTVTTSGLSAANAILKKFNKEPYAYREGMKSYVRFVEKPFTSEQLFSDYDESTRVKMHKAMKCRYCERPTCSRKLDVRGIMRRTTVGNFVGAKKICLNNHTDDKTLEKYERSCIYNLEEGSPVEIKEIFSFLSEVKV